MPLFSWVYGMLLRRAWDIFTGTCQLDRCREGAEEAPSGLRQDHHRWSDQPPLCPLLFGCLNKVMLAKEYLNSWRRAVEFCCFILDDGWHDTQLDCTTHFDFFAAPIYHRFRIRLSTCCGSIELVAMLREWQASFELKAGSEDLNDDLVA
jgi:hypothetical protein